ncbi:MAG: alanine--tRNA ligase [Candidatus Cloacimonadales bacterium]|jgi:alanyl-tRNA synthetase|nr:alanine--tRNA ligase [Candidatus Cloacimonadota bacterium]MDX9977697.1 alanine--tRNA ligase [Candidatus Cloacimonadales bacterium]
MLTGNEIRQQFIDFFKEKGHIFVPSSSVVPTDDPTLLFTNAGMNQFKQYFLGIQDAPYKRAVNSQKCIRAGGKHNDLEEVGKDSYHHTFFEMLGNWSFGDYYKEDAIKWAWELLTEVWKLPKDKLYATVHDSDYEAYELWKTKTDINPEHISFHGDVDNFWEMGETGPCGPCTEIHIDTGIEYCDKVDDPNHNCVVNSDCHRYIELWNLVFMQFERQEDRSLIPLKNKFVDTGAGLERLCRVIQNKTSNYDTDLFANIIDAIADITQEPYLAGDDGVAHRVIADHIRCLCFAIADGGMPSNEGRGYVLRRILRRAARYGRLLNQNQPFLYQLSDIVAEHFGKHFSELKEKLAYIKMIIKAEEERFNLTLDNGLNKFNEIVDKLKSDTISGLDVFILYDTYGFPPDLTQILAEEKQLKIDMDGFDKEMEKQKERARSASNFKLKLEDINWIHLKEKDETVFLGYDQSSTECFINKYALNENGKISIVLDKTPFYAESGGQVADTGRLFNDSTEIRIIDVQKHNNEYIHVGEIVKGEISKDKFTAMVEDEYRLSIARNHTATHLLHAALRQVLGEHVQQKGSLVATNYLRFDFTHINAVNQKELEIIEDIVNNEVKKATNLTAELMSIDDAKSSGAMALFGEKYADEVRVVSVPGFSKELCGGTHLENTGQIGFFKILSESSSAAGIRRIEAVTGTNAEQYVKQLKKEISDIAILLNTPEKKITEKIERMIAEHKELINKIEALKQNSAGDVITELLNKAVNINNIKLVVGEVNVQNQEDLKILGDKIKDKIGSGISILAAVVDGKVAMIVNISKDLTKEYHAGKIVSKLADIVGGKGGGRPDMAMAGGKLTDKINELLSKALEILE